MIRWKYTLWCSKKETISCLQYNLQNISSISINNVILSIYLSECLYGVVCIHATVFNSVPSCLVF